MKKAKLILLFLLLAFTANACAGSQVNTIPTTTAVPTALPTTVLAVIGESACVETSGSVERFEIASKNMLGPQWMSVYTPPCYNTKLAGGYPVLYVFNGQTFDDNMWYNLGAGKYLDEMIAANEAKPFIIVSVFDEFFYRAVRGNKFPDAVIEEVIPWVDENFNTCTERDCRAIGGISRGAAWAMRLGLTFPDLFGAIGMHSLPTYLGGPDQVRVWVETYPKDQLPAIWIDSGRLDTEIKSAIATEAVFSSKGFPHEWHLNEGRHEEAYWQAQMEIYMRWYASLWAD